MNSSTSPKVSRIIDSIVTEYEVFFNAYREAFHETIARTDLIFSNSSYLPEFSTLRIINDEAVSFGGGRRKRMRIFEKDEIFPCIFGVVTIPKRRKEGHASHVVKTLVKKAYDFCYNVIMISANSERIDLINFYKKFGFTDFSYQKSLPFVNLFKKGFDNIQEVTRDKINDKDYEEICRLVNEYTKGYKVTLQRDIEFTKNKVEGIFADNGRLFFLSKDGKNYGYFLLRKGEVEENVILGEDEPNEEENIIKNKFIENKLEDVFGILKDKNIERTATAEESGKCIPKRGAFTLIRIVNPKNFMKKYMDYIYSGDGEVETFSKNITVEDSIIGDCSFNIKKNGNDFEFSEELDNSAIDNITITISDFTKTIFEKFLNNNTYGYLIENKIFFCENW